MAEGAPRAQPPPSDLRAALPVAGAPHYTAMRSAMRESELLNGAQKMTLLPARSRSLPVRGLARQGVEHSFHCACDTAVFLHPSLSSTSVPGLRLGPCGHAGVRVPGCAAAVRARPSPASQGPARAHTAQGTQDLRACVRTMCSQPHMPRSMHWRYAVAQLEAFGILTTTSSLVCEWTDDRNLPARASCGIRTKAARGRAASAERAV